jgi:hypothetical protein
MTPTRRLARLRSRASGRLGKLRQEAAAASLSSDYRIRDRAAEHLAIALLNSWANFNRAYYLSTILAPTRAKGGRITVDPKCRGWVYRDALDNYIVVVKGWTLTAGVKWTRRDEAAWHVVDNLIAACADLKCSNQKDIESAFAAGQKVFGDLPTFRNYFGHRNEETLQKALRRAGSYGIPATTPAEIMLARPIRRPQPLVMDWIDEVDVTVEFLCT